MFITHLYPSSIRNMLILARRLSLAYSNFNIGLKLSQISISRFSYFWDVCFVSSSIEKVLHSPQSCMMLFTGRPPVPGAVGLANLGEWTTSPPSLDFSLRVSISLSTPFYLSMFFWPLTPVNYPYYGKQCSYVGIRVTISPVIGSICSL
jgi:hypothetical protein